MSEFFLPPNIARLAARRGLESAASRPAERTSTVFVDVAEQATRAEISRAGFALGEIAVNRELIATFLEDLILIRTKVVSQSVVPGTAVARGTAIDVIIANPHEIPLRVIPNGHVQFENNTMGQLHERFAGNATLREIIRRRRRPEEMTAAERQTFTNEIQQQDVLIDEQNTIDQAFTSIQAAFTFLG